MTAPGAAVTEFTNYISEEECLERTERACGRIRRFERVTDVEKRLADDAQLSLFDPYTGDRIAAYRGIFLDYQAALDTPWSAEERDALPYVMARQPLWGFAKWVNILDEDAARGFISDMGWYLKWGKAILEDASVWRRVTAPA